jgi:hypothetical protein
LETQDDAGTTARGPRKRALRTLRDVETATTAALAMMTSAQVKTLSAAARARRVELLRGDDATEWGIADIAAYLGCAESTVRKYRWRTGKEEIIGEVDPIVLPKPVRFERGGRGAPRPRWPLSQIVTVWAPKKDLADRRNFVPFPGGRKRRGRAPDAAKATRVAPAQRVAPPQLPAAAAAA